MHNHPARYGNLSQVAMRFYIATGNPAELDAVYWYARYAARSAAELIMMRRLS